MKVLYVNHTGAVSGAERSLLDLLRGIGPTIAPRVACPTDGALAHALISAGIPMDAIPGTDASLRLDARETPRAVGALAHAAARTAVHARRRGPDVIHANSIRAGLLAVPGARALGIPLVVHVRDRLPRSRMADTSLRVIAGGAQIVVANSRYTAEGVRAVSARGQLVVIHNPVDLSRFDPAQVDSRAVRQELGLSSQDYVLGVIGQITPWKGQREAIEALIRLRDQGSRARLLVVGEPKFVSSATRYDNVGYHAELRRLIAVERVGDRVKLLGERTDTAAVMASLDTLLVPSWQEPFGRVVIEAQALGIPVLATKVGGPSEIIRDGIDGILLEPRNASLWADAIGRLERSPGLRTRVGKAAMARAKVFSLPNHVAAIRDIYRRVSEGEARRPSR